MSNVDPLETYTKTRESFSKLASISTGLGLLAAAASRIPTWEVASPVGWIVGSLNVGFLPVFGPILVLGAACNVYVALREVADLRAAALGDSGGKRTQVADAILRPPRGAKRRAMRDRRLLIASWILHLWHFWVPVLSYVILMSTYFDFVRPSASADAAPVYTTRSGQIVDLLVGTGGVTGFRPSLPSIQSALEGRQKQAAKPEETARLKELSELVPWIYPPAQTWAYLGGLGLLIYMSTGAWKLGWEQ